MEDSVQTLFGNKKEKMIRFMTLKQDKKDQADGPKKTKTSAAVIRAQKDISELNLPSTCKVDFPDPTDLLNFVLTIKPDDGMYKGGVFKFSFHIKDNYPHEAPKLKCLQKIYHPNIDLQGNVCLNILRDDWKPVLTIQAVVFGMQYLFLEPNPDDPLNKEAAEVLKNNRTQFEQYVQKSMRGGYVGGETFDNVLTG